ncbi:hypothetical protein ACM6Q7_10165 [Peribacillus butanolivorans]|uniref:hypothetical protein n=1 Tax=Peribacillus butanolivorans TaxID=421767 RepID=UPI0039FBB4E0
MEKSYISEFYPREARATGMGWDFGVGRIGAIIEPMLIALILSLCYSFKRNMEALIKSVRKAKRRNALLRLKHHNKHKKTRAVCLCSGF